ncbi:MAG: GrpB family protein [Promethearchaeota archaeon]
MHKDTEPVTVQDYDPVWKTWSEELQSFLDDSLSRMAVRMEHVGSTAIPGMVAKPIIDLVIVISVRDFEEVKSRLAKVGFIHRGDLGIKGREAFLLTDVELKKHLPPHHLYVCDLENEELRRLIAFRDYLRVHPEDAAEYSKLKIELVKQYSGDRVRYIDGKDNLVKEILEKALQWSREKSSLR